MRPASGRALACVAESVVVHFQLDEAENALLIAAKRWDPSFALESLNHRKKVQLIPAIYALE